MKKLLKKLEDMLVAVTFAEAGEYDEAMRLEGRNVRSEETQKMKDYKRTALQRPGK